MNEKKSHVVGSVAQKELEKIEKQLESFDESIKEMTLDKMNSAQKVDVEPQTKISGKDLDKMKDIYLKPIRVISAKDKFNEKFKEQYEYDKQYVQFIAEHKEIIGDDIDIWTRPYGGMPAEEWKVPTNKPVWGPRYLAEQIKRCKYARLIMKENILTESGYGGQLYGALAADTIVQRLDAYPASTKRSVFMGAGNF